MAHVSLGDREYGWSSLSMSSGRSSDGWAHHDVTVTPDGLIVTGRPDGGGLRILNGAGSQVHSIALPLSEAHCIRLASDDVEQGFWVADNGVRWIRDGQRYAPRTTPGRVARILWDGTIAYEIAQPAIDAYQEEGWMPTAVVPVLGRQTLWIADGYSRNLIHLFSNDGSYMQTLDGSDSGLPFLTPHALLLDTRRPTREVYVADRGNRRIVVFGEDGRYLRTVGEGILTSPSGLALSDGLLVVTELYGALTAFDVDDVCVGRFGRGDAIDRGRPGWPNIEVDDEIRPPLLTGGIFNSPHGIAADSHGALYISEWLIGGRLVQLKPQ